MGAFGIAPFGGRKWRTANVHKQEFEIPTGFVRPPLHLWYIYGEKFCILCQIGGASSPRYTQ